MPIIVLATIVFLKHYSKSLQICSFDSWQVSLKLNFF